MYRAIVNSGLVVVLSMVCFLVNEAKAQEIKANPSDNMPTDFDFLMGNWRITNKILKKRLSNSNEWNESVAFSRCWKILDGLGNMDEFEMISRAGKSFKGNTIRVYSPTKKEWTLYWVDNWNPDLGVTKQTTGTFSNGVGTFYGEEEYEGKIVRQKFTWKSLGKDKAYWDQAYYDEQKGEWEINWIMLFDRIKD